MNPYAVLGFAGVALSLIIVPGPDWAYILAAGVRERVVVPAVGGLLIGYALITAVVAAGIGPLVSAVPGFLVALTIAGAAYLAYLGVMTLRSASSDPDVTAQASAAVHRRWGLLGRGIGVSALNPKGLLLFLAILPQFAHPTSAWPMTAQLALLGAVFVALCGAFYLSLGFGAIHLLGSRPGIARITRRVSGIAMLLVAGALIVERIVQLAGGHV